MSQEIQDNSTTVSSYASNAFSVLSDQIENTVYFLKIEAGITALAEDDSSVSQNLIFEVFEIRSEIEET